MSARIVLSLFLFCTLTSMGQMEEKDTRIWLVDENADKLIVAHANGEREDAVRFIWERSTLGGYEMIAISRDGIFPSAKLVEVMRTALGGYLDVRIKFSSDGVRPEAEVIELPTSIPQTS